MVLTLIALTLLSLPGGTLTILARGQCKGEELSFFNSTSSFFFIFCEVWNHFGRFCNRLRYSIDNRFQNTCWICEIRCQALSLFSERLVTSFSGWAVRLKPIKKLPGVKHWRSLGSLDKLQRGLEFKIASICVKMV